MAAAPPNHLGQHQPGEVEHGDEVEGEHAVGVVFSDLDERAPRTDAGVVDEDVDRPELGVHGRVGPLRFGALGEIGHRDRRAAAPPLDLLAHGVEVVGGTGDESDSGSAAGGGDRDRASDPARRPGDEHGRSLPKHVAMMPGR